MLNGVVLASVFPLIQILLNIGSLKLGREEFPQMYMMLANPMMTIENGNHPPPGSTSADSLQLQFPNPLLDSMFLTYEC